jgi:hypothetical protein
VQPNTPELDDVVREIENKGRRSLAIPTDVSLDEDGEKIIQQVVQELGSLNVVSPSDGCKVPSAALIRRTSSV